MICLPKCTVQDRARYHGFRKLIEYFFLSFFRRHDMPRNNLSQLYRNFGEK